MTENKQKGAALVIVIWAMAIIGAVVAAYFTKGLLEAKYTREQKDEAEARSLAQAGLACFIQRYLADEDEVDDLKDAWMMGEDNPPPAFPEGKVEVRVADYGSRINLNLATEAELLELFGGKKAPVDAILDWLDEDKDPHAAGAEGEYYGKLSPPLQPADGMFQCQEEVALVKGMDRYPKTLATETTVYGRANPNLISAYAWKQILVAAGFDEMEIERLTEQFTQYQQARIKAGVVPFTVADDLKQLPSATYRTVERLEPFLTFGGQVNPNFATEGRLRAALARIGMKIEKARLIVEVRDANPFKDLGEVTGILAQDENAGIKRDWPDQVFSLQTTLVGVEVVGKTKNGSLYRLAAVVERFHPPRDSSRWRCRILAWREWPGQDFPVLKDKTEEEVPAEAGTEDEEGK